MEYVYSLDHKNMLLTSLLKAKEKFDAGTAGNSGICCMVELDMCLGGCPIYGPLLHKFFKTWEHYSGQLAYPISIHKNIRPAKQYGACIVMGKHWPHHDKYIAKRIDLLCYIIRELGREIYLESTNGAIQ